MYDLMRRSVALRTLPKWIILGPLVTAQATSLRCVGLFESGGAPVWGSESAEVAIWVLILWLPVSIFVAMSGAAQRISYMDMALPIPARRLWSAHMLVQLLAGAVILAISVLAMYGAKSGIDKWIAGMDRTPVTPDIDRIVPHMFAGFVLAVVLVQSYDWPLCKTRGGLRYVVVSIAVVLAVWIAVSALSLVSPVAALVPLLVAFALGLRILRALPPVFSVAPRRATGREVPPAKERTWRLTGAGLDSGRRRSLPVSNVVFQAYSRSISKPFFAYPFLFLMGLIMAGGLIDDEVLRFLNVSLIVYMLLIFTALSVPGLYLLDALPISRRRLFAALVLPGLAVLGAGYLSGLARVSLASPSGDLVQFREEDGCDYLYVPVRECEIAWDGTPPQNSSPWGESRWAWRARALPWHGAVIYSPFTTPDSSSMDFVALQTSRAIRAVYGGNVSPADISERYLAEDSDGRVIVRESGMSLQKDYPDLEPGYKGPLFPVLFLLVGLPWLIMLSLYFRTIRVGIPNSVRKVVIWGLAALCLGFYVAPIPLVESGLIRLWAIVGVVEILLRHAGSAPAAAAAVWVVSFLLLAGAYWAAQREFERIEAPADPARISPQLL